MPKRLKEVTGFEFDLEEETHFSCTDGLGVGNEEEMQTADHSCAAQEWLLRMEHLLENELTYMTIIAEWLAGWAHQTR